MVVVFACKDNTCIDVKYVFQSTQVNDWEVMILTQILQPSCVRAPLIGQDKEAVITELVDLLAESGQLKERDVVLESVLVREQTRSTGIGSGVAIPHGKCAGVSELVMAIGIIKDGIEFDSIDGKPVTIIVLLASPIDRTGPHIQALARISRLMLDAEFKDKLENATSPEEVYELISNKETE
jgi:fructose-specific phosphotransferase system IIA component